MALGNKEEESAGKG